MGFDAIKNGASKLFYQVEEEHVRKLSKSEVNKQETNKQNKLVWCHGRAGNKQRSYSTVVDDAQKRLRNTHCTF